jgi:quinol monooxygenase YgiN
MAEHAHVIDVSRYYPAPGKRDELVQAMLRMASAAATSEGCFGAQACESDQDGDSLVAISRWVSPEALDRFANSPGFVEDRERLKPLLARPTAREHYRPLSS